VTTLRRTNLREPIGTVEREHPLALQRGLIVFLGTAN